MDQSNHLILEENQSCQASLENEDQPCCLCDITENGMTEEVEMDEIQDSLEESSLPSDKKRGRQKFPEEELNALREKTNAIANPDERIAYITEQMESALSQGGTPHFKVFWELRKICLEAFKENISPALRQTAWNKYRELSKEARKLKELFDEQSAFAVEQIEIAINALEQDIEGMESQLEKSDPIHFEVSSKFYEEKKEYYEPVQKKLNLFNAYAARINNLRKELIRTEMRIKHKNKFFHRLSQAGDKIFPERKNLIREISEQFIKDIDGFVSEHFKEDANEPSFLLREEIKSLQGIAKALTLNTNAFTETRTKLSQCWDKLKSADKERKKERAKKRDSIKANFDEIALQISDLESAFKENTLTVENFMSKLDEISQTMRQKELGREEVKELRERLGNARKEASIKLKHKEEEKVKAEKERSQRRIEAIDQIELSIRKFLKEAQDLEIEVIKEKEQTILSSIAESFLSVKDKQELIKKLKGIKDLISEKEEEALLALTDDDKNTLNNLKEVLEQRRKRRSEIQEQKKKLRKAAGSSGLNFEKAMEQQLQIKEEAERLEKADLGIKEIEEKIAALKKKIRNSKNA